MKKGCALTLAVWAACAALYAYLAWPIVQELMPTLIIALLGGTAAGMLLAATVGLFTGGTDRAAIRRARAGEPMKDGRLEAASGPIRPLGTPLEAPFSGRPCVAYEYDVKSPGGGKSDFAGVALTPSAIDATRGPVKLLGWAMLDAFPSTSRIDEARADAYLAGAPMEPLGISRIIGVLSELAADDDGSIRKDFQIGGATPTVAGKATEEKILPPGQVVTVLGIWSEAKGGFAPSGRMSMNRIFATDLDAVARKVGSDPYKTFGTALFFFLALHAILVPMYFLGKQHRAQERGSSRARPEEAAPAEPASSRPSLHGELDPARLRELLAQGADPNERIAGLSALMFAARQGDVAAVQALAAAGARVDDADDHGDTAMSEAIVTGRKEMEEALRGLGAKDFRVTHENGRPLADDSPALAAVKEYLVAVRTRDFAAMARLVPGNSREDLEKRRDDLRSWLDGHPARVAEAGGYENDEAATIRVEGPSGGDRDVSRVGMYHLQKTLEGWRIFREWYPQDF